MSCVTRRKPARRGSAAARSGAGHAWGGSPVADLQWGGRGGTPSSVPQELACGNNSCSPDTQPGPACGGPGPAGGGPPPAAPQGCGRGITQRSAVTTARSATGASGCGPGVPEEFARSNNSRSLVTRRGPARGGPGPACGGPPTAAPQGCGCGVTRRSVPQELAHRNNSRSRSTRREPADLKPAVLSAAFAAAVALGPTRQPWCRPSDLNRMQ